jgi:methionyl-tRNA synthetase
MGHALEFIRADTIARYKKLLGYDVYFNTGTDEHGLKIFEKAHEKGLSALEFVDLSFETFKEQIKMFGVSEDIHFIRTTDKNHEKACQEFWKRVYDNGFIYKKNYEAKYCAGCESEKTDSDLVNGECPDHPGIEIKIINEENYFFKYSEFGDKLLALYENNPDFVIPDFRFHEVKNFIQNGLQDFSISRLKEKMPWGIPVPDDDTQVMYVWFDALVNYISTLDWPEETPSAFGTSPLAGGEESNFQKYWINGNPTQYCGKDNTRFQASMWQAMLMACGLPNSHQIIVNGFITGEGGIKMSKSLGNVVDPRDIVKEYGTDALRYFLLREVSSFEDSPFTLERFKDAYNSGLANGLGNLVSRVMTMAVSYNVKLSDEDLKIKYYTENIPDLENFDITKFINLIWLDLSNLDEYIQKNEPFKKIKINKEDAEKDVKYLLFHLYGASLALEPLLPETAKKIQQLIKENKKPETPLFLRKD